MKLLFPLSHSRNLCPLSNNEVDPLLCNASPDENALEDCCGAHGSNMVFSNSLRQYIGWLRYTETASIRFSAGLWSDATMQTQR